MKRGTWKLCVAGHIKFCLVFIHKSVSHEVCWKIVRDVRVFRNARRQIYRRKLCVVLLRRNPTYCTSRHTTCFSMFGHQKYLFFM